MKPGRTLLVAAAVVLAAAVAVAEEAKGPAPTTLKAFDKIGTWDGKTASAELEGPYEDPLQATVRFGQKSYWLAPWRAWMDTWPAARFLRMPGVNFNVHEPGEFEPVATILAEAGITGARVEVGWGSFRYENPAQLVDAERLRQKLATLKRHGIRPLMLLNANSGWPCPIRSWRVRLIKDAPEGARKIAIDKTDAVRPHYTGLRGQDYQTAFPLIVKADAATGRCELSAPLKKAIKAGEIELNLLKYPPLSGEFFADGRPNPAGRETLDGWLVYVAALCRITKEALGTEGADDAGFDLEVWNELTFGSHFLEDRHYYDPPREWKKPRFRYKGKDFGYEVLLAMTVDYACDPASRLPGVRVIDGFSNQRPWENGTDMWPGQAGISRHYYTACDPFKDFDGGSGCVSHETDASKRHIVLDALGKSDGKVEKGDSVPDTYFVPTFRVALPETWFYGYKTEMMSREVVPWPDTMKGHGRYSHPGTGRHAEIWQTEFNIVRAPWADRLVRETGCAKDNPRLIALMHDMAAKAMLRTFFFYNHKGLTTIDIYAAREPDTFLGMIPMAFYKALEESGYKLTDEVRSLRGPQLEAVGRAVRVMKTGKPLDEARPLAVAKLVEEKPRLVFKGDGTAAHPDRYHRDDFACLPYQQDADRFVVAYYVVTRNIVHAWAKDKDALDPARYRMPDQIFRMTLSNVRGRGAKVSATDPLTGRDVPVKVLASGATTLTVALPTVDYPRLLVIEESGAGPLVVAPDLAFAADGSARLTFRAPVKAPAKVSWGTLPERTSGGSVTLDEATEFSAAIPKLEKGCGVKVEIEADGLAARWPRWGHDTAGVLW